MSGHSKWSVIKRAKGVTDARRSQVFTKLGHAITVAARLGGADPTMNFRLRLAIEKAKAASLPKDNIDRAIAKGSGTDGKQIEEVTYEGFGPGGASLVIQTMTDNRNRTVTELRTLLGKKGGNLGNENSVAWQFSSKGVLRISADQLTGKDKDALELGCIDAGADDVQDDPEGITTLCPPTDLPKLQTYIETQKLTPASADVELVPNTPLALAEDENTKLHNLIEALEEHDDVTAVWTNAK
ncbi:MAG: YebC/PmpR family DNA-binding transcriptional regulator [Patescibacteria group bacterium]